MMAFLILFNQSFTMKQIFTALFICSICMLASCKKSTEGLQSKTENVKPPETEALSAKFSITVQDPINIFENQSIKFNNASTGFKTCVWEFGNTTKTQQKEPTMSYPMHGYYTVQLTVFDDKGNSAGTTQDISILCLFANGSTH
jgi:hypothetical protein